MVTVITTIEKKINCLICLLLISIVTIQISSAQNVGIGTTSPGASLDVIRGTATGGTAQFRGTNNISHFNHGSTEETYIRGGKVGSHVILNDLGSGFVGIGTSSPGFPLNFPNTLGDKISLWGNSGAHYGFGIQGGQLQIHTDQTNSDVLFGYGSSFSFTESMRIKGNGILQFPNGFGKRILFYRGTTGDAHIGMYGNELRLGIDDVNGNISFGYDNNTTGFVEKFKMKANGAFAVNGSEGQAAQVLSSNGTGNSASWQSLSALIPTFYIYNEPGNNQSVETLLADEYALPNSTLNITINKPSRLIISATFLQTSHCPSFGGCSCLGTYYFKMNGTQVLGSYIALAVDGEASGSVTLSNFFYDVNPGTYSISFFTRKQWASTTYWGKLSVCTIIALPL